MINIKISANSPAELTDPADQLLKYLFADKKTVYVDDVNINGDVFEVSYCMDHTLHLGKPQWKDIDIDQYSLIDFIISEKLNYWESFRYDPKSGSVQPVSNVNNDIGSFLNENYREVIKEFLEAGYKQ